LVAEEQFCGECGTPRSGEYQPPSMQSKVASMLSMQEAVRKNTNGSAANAASATLEPHEDFIPSPSGRALDDAAEREMPDLFRLSDLPDGQSTAEEMLQQPLIAKHALDDSESDLLVDTESEDAEDAPAETALVRQGQSNWTSAAAAREFLERLSGRKPVGSSPLARFLTARRGDLYLVLAVILVAIAVRWGIWSNHSVSATGNPSAAAHRRNDADLPFYDRLLIKLGLAEAPDVPEDKGNPDVQVWVDLHTALYYCPGADLYGKGPKGKYETQRDAQLDQFEPANRKACN
jgi:hypothetical protein